MGVVARITDTAEKLDPSNLFSASSGAFAGPWPSDYPATKAHTNSEREEADTPGCVGHGPEETIDLRFVNLCKDMVNEKNRSLRRGEDRSHKQSLGVQNLVTFLHECPNIPDAPYSEAVASLLQASWPAFVTLTPDLIGTPEQMGVEPGTDPKDRLLHTIQMLTDSGLITYEALIMSSDHGLRVIDVALTARGRSVLRPPFRS